MTVDQAQFEELRDRLIRQLDTLVPFLALAHREVFDILSDEYDAWTEQDQHNTLPNTYNAYLVQVANAAFLLGYSYAEAFVTDLICLLYTARKDLLPAEKTLRYQDILEGKDYESIVSQMIDRILGDMNSLESKLAHLNKRFSLQNQPELMRDAHVARNALIHNAGHVNRVPPDSTRWTIGEQVQLSVVEVHSFGIMARTYCRELSKDVASLCASGPA